MYTTFSVADPKMDPVFNFLFSSCLIPETYMYQYAILVNIKYLFYIQMVKPLFPHAYCKTITLCAFL